MHIEQFQSGHFRQQIQYRSFSPTPINLQWSWADPQVNSLLAEANRWIGELNAFGQILPDVDLYIKMHVLKEASSSSRIEGTRTSLDAAAMPEEEIDPEGRDDWREVQNYVCAMNLGVERLATLPLSNRLLRETHAVLMAGVRGEHKNPGEFRTSQNWIGGTSLADAVFIPPHADEVPELMSDLERFWHNREIQVPHLIRIALSHYQFETIHPFQDGNGRSGRLLITLYLMSHGLLAKPCLYLSAFFEKNRSAYYDALMAVRTRHDLLHWIRFFLTALNTTAQDAVRTFRLIVDLKSQLDAQVHSLGRRAHNGAKLLKRLYDRPAVRSQDVVRELQVSPMTAQTLLDAFAERDILREVTGFRRNRLYLFERYLNLFRT
jgi:Fic family protein